MKKLFLFFAIGSATPEISAAQTSMPGFFADSMVIQQNTQVTFWGNDKPGRKVTITTSWGSKGECITNNSGKWKCSIMSAPAGGPYSVTVSGSSTKIIREVLCGEVWLCSGQSNMEMPLRGNYNQPVVGSNDAIIGSKNSNIRFLLTPRDTSSRPLSNVKSHWYSAGPEVAGRFSAVAYFFAHKLAEVIKVPIGIIQTAWGASTIESWMDSVTLAKVGVMIPPDSAFKEPNKVATGMYNTMLHPYIGYTIKGVLWYQGEANREDPAGYAKLFPAMIRSWRDQWEQGAFPFYYVQIAPFNYPKGNAALLREVQQHTMYVVENTGMAVTLDIGEKQVIHPSRKKEVGERLALWALAKDYGITGFAYSGPIYRSMKYLDNKILLQFDYAGNGFKAAGDTLTGFEVAGEDKLFYPAVANFATGRDKGIVVSSPMVKNPVHARYAFYSWTVGSLFNSEGLPASSFRTDSW